MEEDTTEKPAGGSAASGGGSRRFRMKSIKTPSSADDHAPCPHAEVMKDLCVQCGQDLRQLKQEDREVILESATISMIHNVPELKVSAERAEQLGRQDEERLLRDRKLVLLVDLDQTLIHTTNENVPEDMPGVCHFQLYGPETPWYHTKLRPYVLEFLEKMSTLYELHICTFGVRMYAHKVAELIDPHKKLFHYRILSRDECLDPRSKTGNLKSLFPTGDSLVAIIDDREDVWNFAANVITVKAYSYFKNTGDINSPYKPSRGIFQSSQESIASSSSSKESTATASAESTTNIDSSSQTPSCSTAGDESSQESSQEASSQDSQSAIEEASPVPSLNLSESSDDSPSSTPKQSPKPDSTEVTQEKEDKKSSNNIKKDDSAPQPDSSQKELEDTDDYLLYLEDILTKIHKAFYDEYDERKKYRVSGENMKIPDLKEIIPQTRKQVLKGVNIVFSGVVPTNVHLEKSRPYLLARALGANVCKEVIFESEGSPLERTTHVVAAKFGTAKVNKALKRPKIFIVNPFWLDSCAERWERVDERLFLLQKDDDFQAKGKEPAHPPPPATSSTLNNDDNVVSLGQVSSSQAADDDDNDYPVYDRVTGKRIRKNRTGGNFQDTSYPPEPGPSTSSGMVCDDDIPQDANLISHPLNQLSMFTPLEIQCMDKEVEDACSEGDIDSNSTSSEDEVEGLSSKRPREESSSEDSLSGDAPKGWQGEGGRKKIKVSPSRPHDEDEEETVDSTVFAQGLSSESDSNISDASTGSLDENMAADMVEREFLGDSH